MLASPGIISLWLASIAGRLPIGALGVLLLLRTREMTGSYAAGGMVAAAFGLAGGLGQPVLGRMIDRRGQWPVLVPAGLAQGALLGAVAALPDDTPVPAIALLAALAGGATPPLSSCLRALLFDVVAPALRHRAFAVDSTLFELVYITGPLVIVGVIGAQSLRAAVATCGALTAGGTIVFAATRLSRATRGSAAPDADLAGPLRDRNVVTYLIAAGLFGLSIANLEVGLAAFAGDEGHRSAVGYLLGLNGLGSLIGGLVASRLPAPAHPDRRLIALLLALSVLEVPLALMGSLPAMAVTCGIAGVAIAPSLALTFQLASEVAPEGTVTETLTWLVSAIAAGIALGSAIAGLLAEENGPTIVLATVAVYTAAEAAFVAART